MSHHFSAPRASVPWDHSFEDRRAQPLQGTSGFEPYDLATRRAEVLTMKAEAQLLERPRLASALMRLALMTELLECLWEEAPKTAVELSSFCQKAFGNLHLELEDDEVESIATWVLTESTQRWGEFLQLLDVDEPLPTRTDFLTSIQPVQPAKKPQETRPVGENDLLRLLPPSDHPKPSPASKPLQRQSSRLYESDDTSPLSFKIDSIPPQGGKAGPKSLTPLKGSAQNADTRNSFEVPEIPTWVAIDAEFAETFLDEANDLFERIQSLVLTLAPGQEQRPALLELGRCFHTLKGAAGSVGLIELAGLIHSAEEGIEAASLFGGGTNSLIDLLHKILIYMEGLFKAIRSGSGTAQTSGSCETQSPRNPRTSKPLDTATDLPAVDGPIRISSERLDELMDLVSELITRRGLWTAQAETMKDFGSLAKSSRNRLLGTIDRIQDLRPSQPLAHSTRSLPNRQSDLPELSRRLAEQADDLVILTDTAQAFAKPLADNSDALAGLTLKIWESLQAIRIVPVRVLFQRLARVAHDASRVEGRRVEIVMSGEDLGLDRAVLDKAFEPMLHLVRNAVAHGIEPAADRLKAGKSEAGIVYLEATRAGNTMVLSVRDDGKGLDHCAIERKGRRLGLIGVDEKPDVDRLNSLIFHPGFSTKDEANSIAGRGVGMDVVSQEVGRIHGTVVLSSVQGEGTRVSLHLPSRLSLEQAMLVRVDDQVFSMPVELIEAVESFDRDGVEIRGSKPWVKPREEWIPLVSAREALGIESATSPSCPKLLLVRVEGKPLAVVIDSIDGTRELVIKPLGPLVAGHPIVSGTSLLVTGEVVLALNPSGLARWTPLEAAEGFSTYIPPSHDLDRNTILVVDDSISVRKIVARQLRTLGFEVEEASDGLEALGKIRGSRYAMIFTDLDMPRMDGFDLLGELSNQRISVATPVIVASTRSDDETRRRIFDLGARGFIAKPIDSDELSETVRKWIGLIERDTAGRPAPKDHSEIGKANVS